MMLNCGWAQYSEIGLSLAFNHSVLFNAGRPQNTSHKDKWIYAKMLMSLTLADGSVSFSSVSNEHDHPSGEENTSTASDIIYCRKATYC